MVTLVAVRFPLGRYHATPWDRSVNEGATEWPPSPWRLLRALVATWYTRWPELPAADFDEILDALAEPPSYRTPRIWPAHTRHYLPGLEHKKGESGGTALTLDPFLSLRRKDELLVRWEADLPAEQRAVLAKLVELVPYLGRAESACEMRLLDDDIELDDTWFRPDGVGSPQVRLLAPARPLRRSVLEQSTVEVRKARRITPPGTIWVSYAAAAAKAPEPVQLSPATDVSAIRFFVSSPAPLRETNGVLLADDAHRQIGRALERAGIPDDRRRTLLGSNGASSDHQHAHWIPLADETGHHGHVSSLVIWVKAGLAADEVAAALTLRRASGKRGAGGDGYEIRGFPEVELLFQSAGSVEQVVPELSGPSRLWCSETPYLPVRHRKQETLDDFVLADVSAELRYRGRPSAKVTRIATDDGLPDRWSREYRRYRMKEKLGKARPGLGLRLEFDEPVSGPLLLGQLSHFGYGIFRPERG